MATSSQYNQKSPAVKRLMKEATELRLPTEDYFAQPLEENLFEWHFTLRGPKDSPYAEGIYHGRIILPTDYPLKPPHLYLFTPNGRFQTNKKICLTISGHHPESWQPSWSIRTILLALIGFMPSEGLGTIGSLDYTKEERQQLAKKSIEWKCNVCGKIKDLLKERGQDAKTDGKKDEKDKLEDKDKELLKMINFKGDVDPPTSAPEAKVITKIGTQDNGISNRNTQNTSRIDQGPTVPQAGTQSNVNSGRPSQAAPLQSTLQSSQATGRSLLSRISPTMIVILIVLILVKRFYSSFF